MSTINTILTPLIENALKKSIRQAEVREENNSLSDLYLSYNPENLELSVYDDMERLLQTISFESSIENPPVNLEKIIIASTKSALHNLEKAGIFNKENVIIKPFSVNWVDDSFIVQEELLFLDDDTVQLNNSLLENLDQELNEFLKDLLSR